MHDDGRNNKDDDNSDDDNDSHDGDDNDNACWLTRFRQSLAQVPPDDLFYLVHRDGRIEARRNDTMDQVPSPGVNWRDSCLLNALCAGNTWSTVTVCYKQDACWMVDKRGTWSVYGSPFELCNEDRRHESPALVYPNVQFVLNDTVEIVVKQGSLLCIELHVQGSHQPQHPRPLRHDPFRPAAPPNRVLFQGSIEFATLAGCWLDRKSATQATTPVPIVMNGSGGRGQVKVLVWAERRRSLFGKLTHQLPSQLVIKLVNLSVSMKDQRHCFISAPSDPSRGSIDG